MEVKGAMYTLLFEVGKPCLGHKAINCSPKEMAYVWHAREKEVLLREFGHLCQSVLRGRSKHESPFMELWYIKVAQEGW